MFCPKVLVISARWFRLWTKLKLLHCRIVMFWRRKTVKGGIFKRNFSELLKSWLLVHAFFNLLKLLFFCFHSVNSNIFVILLIFFVYSLPPGTLPSKCCPSPDWTRGSPNTNSCCFWVRDTWEQMDRSVSLELVVSTCQKFFNILEWYRNKLMDWFWFGSHLDSCWLKLSMGFSVIGQMPGCEWDMDLPFPPVYAWSCYRVFCQTGHTDLEFLQNCFNRLQLNFKWWIFWYFLSLRIFYPNCLKTLIHDGNFNLYKQIFFSKGR